jgi:D-alanine-D-alanine ligase
MKPKIAVLMGGHSLERDISFQSGKRVAAALKKLGYRVASLDVDEHVATHLRKEKPNLCFIALHGRFGEDGAIQGLLEIMGLPYTGSGILASVLGMDKSLSKDFFQQEDIPTPDFVALSTGAVKELGAASVLKDITARLGLPLVVKPSNQGSAQGINFVKTEDQMTSALLGAFSFSDKVILEQYVQGVEVAVSVLGDVRARALPPVEIAPKKGHFDFEAMYTMGATEYFIPARLPAAKIKEIQKIAVKAHKTLGCRDFSRVDFIVEKKTGIPHVLEINTIPGLTETSLFPMAAAEAGLDFTDLIGKIAKSGLARK